ncbi:hypothetical protein [Micromonospora oryzae]|uniref:hypothetical protein n=1 Tax=Micromonospora sp. DSM 102119 TaxID=3111768 RepID=UPI0031D3C091
MDEPIHRWFHLKEAYSAQLLPRLFKDAGWCPQDEISLFDPFAGSGTTLVSAFAISNQDEKPAHLLGIERNPIIQLVASAKLAALAGGSKLANQVEGLLGSVATEYNACLRASRVYETPSVTLNNEKYFDRSYVSSLLALRKAIDRAAEGIPWLILRTCLAASVEPAGRLRRDGRALRYTPERRPVHPKASFDQFVKVCLSDMRGCVNPIEGTHAEVRLGDGRMIPSDIGDKKFDWIVFSPPYPNNIDYTEVYKTEAWALGYYDDTADMRRQRLSTVRSHPSVAFPEEYSYAQSVSRKEVNQLLAPLLAAVPSDRYTTNRRRIIRGYFDDMFQVLKSCRQVLSGDGRLVFVVGNSVHGTADSRFVIAADLIMAALAELTGWKVEEVRVARWTTRRGGKVPFLRESVVCLAPVTK